MAPDKKTTKNRPASRQGRPPKNRTPASRSQNTHQEIDLSIQQEHAHAVNVTEMHVTK